jgi:Zn-dependent peptidase ImmA (M78 family)
MNRLKIKAFIDTLIERHGISRFPVDLNKWAEIAGAEVKVEDFDNELSGFAYQKKGVKIIGINKAEPQPRQRFTTAHELGHMFLHKQKAVNYDEASVMLRTSAPAGTGTEPTEIEANSFAAEILMPEENIRADLEARGNKIDLEDETTIKELAAKYNVSEPAMLIRLTTLYFNK